MPFYAVVSGKNPGIYTNWDDCREQITNFPGAWYKKFKTEQEADKCMKSKDIALRSSGLSAYAAHSIADYSPPWMLHHSHDKSYADTFSMRLRDNNAKGNNIWPNINSFPTEYFHIKVPGLHKRMNYIENNITSLHTSPLAPTNMKQRNLTGFASPPLSFDYWGKTSNPMPYAFDSNWLHAIHTNQIYVPPLIEDYEGFIDVYIDGAVSHKKGTKPRGGIGVWFNHAHPLNVEAPMDGIISPINAEIQAATRAIQQAAAAGLTRLNIHTDSLYLVKSITEWIKTWRKNQWQTSSGKSVRYRAALERLDDIVGSMDAVRWIFIKSHQGNEGNESADTLARNGVNKYGTKKYDAYVIPGAPAK